MDESTRLEPTPATAMEPVSADANGQVAFREPYIATVRVRGSSPFLYHRWSVEAVAEKASAAKGSRAKKTDDIQSYVWRDAEGVLSIPGEYFRQSLIGAARFRQDPRSPRKSAMDLFKAAVVSLSDHCSVGKREWDYIDQRRVTVQRSGITRSRPALGAGWECEVVLSVLLPEYVERDLLLDVLTNAGRLIGVGDFRPTYGRFSIVRFDIGKA